MGSTYNRCDCLCYPIELLAQNQKILFQLADLLRQGSRHFPAMKATLCLSLLPPSHCLSRNSPGLSGRNLLRVTYFAQVQTGRVQGSDLDVLCHIRSLPVDGD